MPKVIVNPPWLPKPSGYSHGIEAQGRTLFIAGQTALDADGRIASRRATWSGSSGTRWPTSAPSSAPGAGRCGTSSR